MKVSEEKAYNKQKDALTKFNAEVTKATAAKKGAEERYNAHKVKITKAASLVSSLEKNVARATGEKKAEFEKLLSNAKNDAANLDIELPIYSDALKDAGFGVTRAEKLVTDQTVTFNAAKGVWDARLLGEKEKERTNIIDGFHDKEFQFNEAQAALVDYFESNFTEAQRAMKDQQPEGFENTLTPAQKAEIAQFNDKIKGKRMEFDAASMKMDQINQQEAEANKKVAKEKLMKERVGLEEQRGAEVEKAS